MKILLGMLATPVLLAIASTAMAVPTGVVSEEFLSLNGRLSGVTLNVEGAPRPTGDISFTLNPTASSYIRLNFDNNTALTRLQLLVTFPLQTQISAPTIPITIEETGRIAKITPVTTSPAGGQFSWFGDFQGSITQPKGGPLATAGSFVGTSGGNPLLAPYLIQADLTGGGIVPPTGSGSLYPFAGISFQNDNKWFGIECTVSVTVCSRGTINAAPEPSTFFLFGLGSCLLGLLTWRRKLEIGEATN